MAIESADGLPDTMYPNSFLIGQIGQDNVDIIEVQFPDKVVERLSNTCFRNNLACAGNLRYKSLRELIADPEILTRFEKQALDALRKELESGGPRPHNSIHLTVQHPRKHVGWESTVPLRAVPADLLEEFDLNRMARGLRVKLAATHVFAPLTDLITFCCEFRYQADQRKYAIRLWSVYPGVDVGHLYGDVTKREGRVFLDFNHPGERY